MLDRMDGLRLQRIWRGHAREIFRLANRASDHDSQSNHHRTAGTQGFPGNIGAGGRLVPATTHAVAHSNRDDSMTMNDLQRAALALYAAREAGSQASLEQ